MTERQERITANRVQDAEAAEIQAHTINRLGGWASFKDSLPERATIVGANGLWHTKARK